MKRLFVLISIFIFYNGIAQVSSAFNTARPKSMSQRWELDSLTKAGTFVFTPYKPVYLMPLRWSSHPDGQPRSGNEGSQYDNPNNQDLNNLEAKFQISFKVKVLQGIFWGYGDLWGAYTQKNHWQVYNNALSRPFRETNYEPEVILNFATDVDFWGIKNRLLGVSFNHQSNGRALPYSRSWNRIIFQAGFETGDWQIYLRPWLRLPDDKDDNPDITSYIGRGEAIGIYCSGRHTLTLTGTSNFELNKNLRGYIEAAWSYRIDGNLKGYLQFTHGYGETLVDYNNRQTTIGLGVSLIEWL